MQRGDRFVGIMDLLGGHLAVVDIPMLSVVSKSVNKSLKVIEEEIFSGHEVIKKLKKSKQTPDGDYMCVHVDHAHNRTPCIIRMTHGRSTKGMLRSVKDYIVGIQYLPVSVHLDLKEEFYEHLTIFSPEPIIIKDEWLHTTSVYIAKSRRVRFFLFS